MLKEILREIENPTSHGHRSRHRGPPRTASLREHSENRFQSYKFQKNDGEWNPLSDIAFKLDITQRLNKLTEQNIREQTEGLREWLAKPLWVPTPEEIANEVGDSGQKLIPMTLEDRVEFITQTILNKGVNEVFFAKMYAVLVRELGGAVKDRVVKTNETTLYDFVANPSDNERDAQVAGGHIRFMALLLDLHWQEYIDVLDRLIEKIETDGNAVLIEMFRDFVFTGGKDVCRAIEERAEEQQFFARFSKCQDRPGLAKRLYFMFTDVNEKLEEWIGDAAPKVVHEEQGVENSEGMRQVRNAYSLFAEMPGAPFAPETQECMRDCRLSGREFLSGCLSIFPDQAGDHTTFCSFVSYGVGVKNVSREAIKQGIWAAIEEYKQGVELDCPTIWNMLSDLIYFMIIRGVIDLGVAKDIKSRFPAVDRPWDWENGMKWFLYDCHDFRRAARIGNAWSPEIKDALSMPDTLKSGVQIRQFSRLVVVAIMRSIFEIVLAAAESSKSAVTPDSFRQWSGLINKVSQRFSAVVEEEFAWAAEQNAFRFTLEDIVRGNQVRFR